MLPKLKYQAHQTEEVAQEEPQLPIKSNDVLELEAGENPHYLAGQQMCQELLNNTHTITFKACSSMKLGSSLKPSEHKANLAVSFIALCDIVSSIANYQQNSNCIITKEIDNLWFNVVTMSDGVKEISDVANAIRQDTQQLVTHTNILKQDLPNIAQPPP